MLPSGITFTATIVRTYMVPFEVIVSRPVPPPPEGDYVPKTVAAPAAHGALWAEVRIEIPNPRLPAGVRFVTRQVRLSNIDSFLLLPGDGTTGGAA